MKNGIIIIVAIIILAAGGYFGGKFFSKKDIFSGSKRRSDLVNKKDFNSNIPSPDRQAELSGRVQEINENEIVVGKFEEVQNNLGGINPEKKREELQNMSDNEKQAMREERKNTQVERKIIGEEIVVVSDETKIYKISQGLRGQNADSSGPEEVSLSDIQVGSNITLWTKQDDSDRLVGEFILVTVRQQSDGQN
jgi:flagellar basal body-associated protein FliL